MSDKAKSIVVAVAVIVLAALAVNWHAGQVKAVEKAVHAHYAIVLNDIHGKTAAAQTAFRQREAAWQTKFDLAYAAGVTCERAADALATPPHSDGAPLPKPGHTKE